MNPKLSLSCPFPKRLVFMTQRVWGGWLQDPRFDTEATSHDVQLRHSNKLVMSLEAVVNLDAWVPTSEYMALFSMLMAIWALSRASVWMRLDGNACARSSCST